MKVIKTILKLELKGDPTIRLKTLDRIFDEYNRLVKIADSYAYHYYPCHAEPDSKKKHKYSKGCSKNLRDALEEFIKKAIKFYGIQLSIYEDHKKKGQITYPTNKGNLVDLMHSNLESAYKNRSLPNLRGLCDAIAIRVSKRPLANNRRNTTKNDYYQRTAEFIINGSNIIFRIGGKRDGLYFIISTKFNDTERLKMLTDAIQGNNGLSIGDPCYLVRKKVNNGNGNGNGNGYRYYIQVSVSKNTDKDALEANIRSKNNIRIVGVDLGISKYLATLFCIEVDTKNQIYKLVDALGIESTKEYINAIRKYEEEKSKLQQGRMRGKVNIAKVSRYKEKEDYTIKNANGDSKRVDLRRQVIGYLCNQIIKFANKNEADVIVIEELKGLSKELKHLKSIKKVLGKLYNDVNSKGIKSINEYIEKQKARNDKGKTVNTILKILNDIKYYADANTNNNHNHNHNIRRVTKYILKQRERIEKRMFLLSVFAYYQFKNELETEALWNGKLLYGVKPSYTSQECLACRSRNKMNRLTQRKFKCHSCKFEMNADFNASANIALRYVGKLLKIRLRPMRNNSSSNSNNSNNKQGKSSSTMTITSATTPLHASINASRKVGNSNNAITDGTVARTMSGVTSTLQGSDEGRSLSLRGQTELPCSVKRLVTLDKFMNEKKGHGG